MKKHDATILAEQVSAKRRKCKFNHHTCFCCHVGNSDFKQRGFKSSCIRCLRNKRCMPEFCPLFYEMFIKEPESTTATATATATAVEEENVALAKEIAKNDDFKEWERKWLKINKTNK